MMDSYFWRMSPFKRLVWLKFFSGGGGSAVIRTVTGAILHITNALARPAKKFVVNLEPVQDLNGQDAPYPAGGGKNLLPQKKYQYTETQVRLGGATAQEAYIALEAGTYTLSIEATVSVTAYYKIGSASGVQIGTNGGTFTLSEDANCVIYCYKSGSLDVDAITRWQLEKGSTATAWSPYENICPITGHTGVNVTRTGKNLFDKTRFALVNFNLITDQSDTDYGYYRGAARSLGYTSTVAFAKDNGGFVGKATDSVIHVSFDYQSVGSRGFVRFYYDDGTDSGTSAEITTGSSGHFSMHSNLAKKCICVNYITVGGSGSKIAIKNLQIEYGESESIYEEFGTTIPIDFATSGENLYDASTITTGYYIAANGVVSSAADSCCSDYISVAAGETYTWSGVQNSSSNNNKRVHAYADGVWQSQITYEGIAQAGEFAITFQVPSGANQIRVSEFLSDTNVQVKHSVGESVYGGTLTYEDGEWKLVVTDAMVYLGTLTWTYDSTYTRFITVIPTIKLYDQTRITPIKSEVFGTCSDGRSVSRVPNYSIYGAKNETNVYVKDTVETDPTTFVALFGESKIIYPLATPTEYTLTESQALTLLQGENNIWADTGDIELTYYADGNVSTLEALNTLLGGRYTNLGTPDDVSDKEALQIILGETT